MIESSLTHQLPKKTTVDDPYLYSLSKHTLRVEFQCRNQNLKSIHPPKKAHLSHPRAGETASTSGATLWLMHTISSSALLVSLISTTKPLHQRLAATVSVQHLSEFAPHPAGLQGTAVLNINNSPCVLFPSKFHPYRTAWCCRLRPRQNEG